MTDSGTGPLVRDRLRDALKSKCPEMRITSGTGKTDFNGYVSIRGGEVLVVGRERGGRIWTDVNKLPELEDRATFASLLHEMAITVPTRAGWAYWERNGYPLTGRLEPPECVRVAQQIRKFLDQVADSVIN